MSGMFAFNPQVASGDRQWGPYALGSRVNASIGMGREHARFRSEDTAGVQGQGDDDDDDDGLVWGGDDDNDDMVEGE